MIVQDKNDKSHESSIAVIVSATTLSLSFKYFVVINFHNILTILYLVELLTLFSRAAREKGFL